MWDGSAKVLQAGDFLSPMKYRLRRAEGAAAVTSGTRQKGRRSCGSRRSTMATRRKKSRTATASCVEGPFHGEPSRFSRPSTLRRRAVGQRGELLFVRDFDRDRRWVRTQVFEVSKHDSAPRVVFSHSSNERYNNPARS